MPQTVQGRRSEGGGTWEGERWRGEGEGGPGHRRDGECGNMKQFDKLIVISRLNSTLNNYYGDECVNDRLDIIHTDYLQ